MSGIVAEYVGHSRGKTQAWSLRNCLVVYVAANPPPPPPKKKKKNPKKPATTNKQKNNPNKQTNNNNNNNNKIPSYNVLDAASNLRASTMQRESFAAATLQL